MSRRSDIATGASWQVGPHLRQRAGNAHPSPVDCQRVPADTARLPLRQNGVVGSGVNPAALHQGRVAALDCGTNSTRLLVVNQDGSTLTRLMRITRLGEGVDSTRRLNPAAIGRTVAVLREYRQIMEREGVAAARLVTTSAVRDAENGAAFLEAASAEVGVPTELLSGEDEGGFAFAGATLGLEPVAGDDVAIDIGGGSTEIALRKAATVRAISLDMGCVRVTERFLRTDPPRPDEIAAAVEFSVATLNEAVAQLPALSDLAPGSRLIGLAGSITTLSALALGLTEYDPSAIHHSRLSLQSVEHWCDILCGEPISARARRRVIAPGREDVIAAGALILREIMRHLDFEECVVSETDMLDGLALSLLERTSAS
jgi:exopolyphosphatase/guanosine-5'-triphosphate,3'-diphosphate pyrophosphatase